MLNRYKNFLKDFDLLLSVLFENHKNIFIAKKVVQNAAAKVITRFSQLEFAYLTQGFINLPQTTKIFSTAKY